MKLGRGGIREIEFFAQTGQLIFGGRDPDLRLRGAVETLTALARKGRIGESEAGVLEGDYRALREVEHRLQMIGDAQTHILPATDEGFARLAAFMGEADAEAWKAALFERMTRVHGLTEGFLAPAAGEAKPAIPEEKQELLERWRTYPALRSPRAVESFERVQGDLLAGLGAAARPDEALNVFDGFLAGLPAGAQLFALFEANPQLVDLIVDIATAAPGLARYLSRNSAVFDAVIAGEFFSDWPGEAALTEALSRALSEAPDYEAKLIAARRWANEWHFRIGVHHLRGVIGAEEAGRQYADLAGAVLGALFPAVIADFSSRHGSPPGEGAAVIGMGSLGAGRLTAGSDLDLIVIYDDAGVAMSDGRRPLAARAYYARLTQALVTALTAPMAGGRLYEVDMRLRPSGRQGPVATSITSFETYQREEAWTWEHLALTRARAAAGSAALAARVEAFRRDLLAGPGDPDKILADVADMRRRLAAEKPGAGGWDSKLGPGRQQDIELIATAAARLAGSPVRAVPDQLEAGGWLTGDEAALLKAAHRDMARMTAIARLLTDRPFEIDGIGAGGRAFLLRAFGEADVDVLRERLDRQGREAEEVIEAALKRGLAA